jgi:hypothetical protein
MATTSWLIVSFGAQGMGLLLATLGIGSTWTCRRLLKHLRPLYPAPVAWRLSQLAPRITKNDDDPTSLTFVGNSATSPKPILRPSPATGRDAEMLDV